MLGPDRQPGDPLFTSVPKVRTFYADLNRAGVEAKDADGRKLDFHALRMTLATRLLRQGWTASTVKLITRHRSTAVLERHYNGLHIGDARAAMASVRAAGAPADPAPGPATEAVGGTGKATGNTSPSDASTCAKPQPNELQGVELRLVGPDGETRYTAPLSGESLIAALTCAIEGEKRSQVEKSRAISAAG